MARQYMTDGQFEEYCRRQAESLATLVELALPRFLSMQLAGTATCEECGAFMDNPTKHKDWHAELERSLRAAFDAIGP